MLELDARTVALSGAAILLAYWWFSRSKHSRLPPGPGMFELLQMSLKGRRFRDLDQDVEEQFKKYGPIVSVRMGGFAAPVIILKNYEMQREVFVQLAEHSSNRPGFMWLVNQLTNKKGIIFNPVDWKTTRRFALHSMRDFGFGKQSLEHRTQEEAYNLVEYFRNKEGQAFDPLEGVNMAVSNIMCSMAFGKTYSFDDEKFAEVLRMQSDFFATEFTQSILNLFPFLRIFGFLSKRFSMKYFWKSVKGMRSFIQEEIAKHRENYDPDNIRDLSDLYIQAEINDFQDMKGMDEEQFFLIIQDLFIAGSETTTTTLRWLFMCLICHPQVQEKCRQEILEKLGSEARPEYRDRTRFPYTIATIQEVIRMYPVAPGTLPHVADKDIEVGEYVIPKNSVVVGLNFLGSLMEPKTWGPDYKTFRPERWLDDFGQLRNIPEYIPFGIGKRACIGEQLARSELFIITVVLLQHFRLQPEDPKQEVSGFLRFLYLPDPYKLKAIPL